MYVWALVLKRYRYVLNAFGARGGAVCFCFCFCFVFLYREGGCLRLVGSYQYGKEGKKGGYIG